MIPTRIREIREYAGQTQSEMGDALGVSQRTIANWESGDRSPSHEKLLQLAEKYHVSMDYLYGRTSIPDMHVHVWKDGDGEEVKMFSKSEKIPTPQEREDLSNFLKSVVENPKKHGAIVADMPKTAEDFTLLVQTIVDQRLKEYNITKDVSNVDE